MAADLSVVSTTIKETYDDVRGLLQTASWEVMDEDQKDDVIAKIVVPRWGKKTADGVVLKGTAWGRLLGTTDTIIRHRVARLQAADQGKSAHAVGPTQNQRSAIRTAKSSIKKHPELAKALLNDPEVTKAATQALVEAGDINALSQATAAVAKNRQVERNRRRVTSGLSKAKTVQDSKPSTLDPGTAAFMSATTLSDALRLIVTGFPQEWAGFPAEARADTDFRDACEEALDKIEIGVASARALINGISNEKLAAFFEAQIGESDGT